MKFEITRTLLGLHLDEVSKAVSSKDVNYSMIKLTVTENMLILQSANQTVRIKSIINNESLFEFVDGQALVDGRLFLNIVKKAEGGTIILEEEKDKLIIKSGKSRFSLNKLSSQFPDQKDQEWDFSASLNAEALKAMISKVGPVVSTNSQRVTLQGVNIRTDKDYLFMFATDGYRGAATAIKNEKLSKISLEPLINIIVPGSDLLTISKIFNHGEVQMSLNKQFISFVYGNIRYDIRLIEGEFPKMERLFETEGAKKIEFNRQALIAAVDRASIVLDNNYPALKFEFRLSAGSGELIISTIRSQIGNACEIVDVKNIDNLEIELGASCKYIMDALRIFDAKQLILHIFSNIKAFVITSPEEELNQFIFPVLLGEGD